MALLYYNGWIVSPLNLNQTSDCKFVIGGTPKRAYCNVLSKLLLSKEHPRWPFCTTTHALLTDMKTRHNSV